MRLLGAVRPRPSALAGMTAGKATADIAAPSISRRLGRAARVLPGFVQ
jgi:hypothetical protein